MQVTYKQVAVVEKFFSIIYRCLPALAPLLLILPILLLLLLLLILLLLLLLLLLPLLLPHVPSVHVEAVGETQLRGRAGRHCGQKRTYRAVGRGAGTHRRGHWVKNLSDLSGVRGFRASVSTQC